MTTTQHRYANILRAIADGEEIQWQASNGNWLNKDHGDSLIEIGQMTYVSSRYRVKPKTITINGFEVPEPLRDMPKDANRVFWPVLASASGSNYDWSYVSENKNVMLEAMLLQGLLHSTREAAQAHAHALISLTQWKSE